MRRRAAFATLLACVAAAPLAHAEVVQEGGLRVSFSGDLAPKRLPRHGSAPISVAVAAKISAVHGAKVPQLRQITIAINRNGRLDPRGLPICRLQDIQPATTANALRACRSSLIGRGHFEAEVLLSAQAPFPAQGEVFAFNGRLHGRPAIFAHVYGTDPVPTSYTLPFEISQAKGTFGTVLHTALPEVTGNSGHVTGLSLKLGRTFPYHGERRSYLSAGCPAPPGLSRAPFPLARSSFGFGKRKITQTLVRSCGVG